MRKNKVAANGAAIGGLHVIWWHAVDGPSFSPKTTNGSGTLSITA
jgi:hypothetical protein